MLAHVWPTPASRLQPQQAEQVAVASRRDEEEERVSKLAELAELDERLRDAGLAEELFGKLEVVIGGPLTQLKFSIFSLYMQK